MLELNAILVQKNSFLYCLLLEGKITQLLRPNYEIWTRQFAPQTISPRQLTDGHH